MTAVPALEQAREPLMEVPQVVGIIRWRLLMPVIAYVTRMPDWLYLALPHIGCVPVVAFVLHVAQRSTESWPRAFAAGRTSPSPSSSRWTCCCRRGTW